MPHVRVSTKTKILLDREKSENGKTIDKIIFDSVLRTQSKKRRRLSDFEILMQSFR